MSKGLEALEELRDEWDFDNSLPKGFVDKRVDIIEKELKALEIIKSKQVDIRSLDNIICLCATDENAIKEYNRCCGEDEEGNDISLTQEEYVLLKEMLL